MAATGFVEMAARRFHLFLGDVLVPMFVDSFVGRVGGAAKKADATMVSALDLKANAAFATLLPTIASVPVLSEEGDWQWPPREDRCWIVDPLDGTHNFLLGTPLIGAAVTLVAAERPVFAAVLLPLERALGRSGLCFAAEDYGAYEWQPDAPRRLAVSRTARLADAVLLLEGSSRRVARSDAAQRLWRATQRSRVNLGAALSAALVACGAMNPGGRISWPPSRPSHGIACPFASWWSRLADV